MRVFTNVALEVVVSAPEGWFLSKKQAVSYSYKFQQLYELSKYQQMKVADFLHGQSIELGDLMSPAESRAINGFLSWVQVGLFRKKDCNTAFVACNLNSGHTIVFTHEK